MPRRGNVPKREVLPDPIYNSVLVTKLVNSIMLDGKKGVAQKVVYGAFDIIKEKTEKDPLDVFTTALENIMPSLEVKARRVGGHGGMDFIMDYRLVYCLQHGLPLDQDVYDAAEWSCIGSLTAASLEHNSMPVAVPDFTRGDWDKVDGFRHAMAQ